MMALRWLAATHRQPCGDAGAASSRSGRRDEQCTADHADEHLDLDYHRGILRSGANLAFDTFGSELRFSSLFRHPSDAERMSHLVRLLDEGFGDQIVVGHDVFVKAHLHAYGGNGYDHLPARVLPMLRTAHAVNEEALDRLTVQNPRRLLTCMPPGPERALGSIVKRDPVSRARVEGRIAQRSMPHARYVEIDSGHVPFAEDPDAFLGAALPFLA